MVQVTRGVALQAELLYTTSSSIAAESRPPSAGDQKNVRFDNIYHGHF